MQTILPINNNREMSVPIVITPHKGFIPCMAVLLQSILENSSKNYYYDIIIIHNEIPVDIQSKFQIIFEETDNFSIRFFDVSDYILRYSFFETLIKHKSLVTTYFRLLIPELLYKYDKIIYLDGDIVVNVDIAGLLEFDISNVMLGAVRDVGGNGDYYAEDGIVKKYRDEVLKLEKPNDYFNAGVLVFNIQKFNEKFTTEQWWQMMGSRTWRAKDQDILNVACANNTLLLPCTWNYVTSYGENSEKYMTPEDRKDREKAKDKPNIIHYVGIIRPWNYCTTPYFDIYWEYAKKSPFYEEAFNQIGEARLVERIIEQSYEGRINIKSIKKIISGWLQFQMKKGLSIINIVN